MPYLVITSWYPSHKLPDIINVYAEMLKKYPPNVLAELGEYCVNNAGSTTEKGLKGMSVFEVKKGKLEEALKTARGALAMFRSIEGYVYTIEVWTTITEGFESIGMQAPT
jgi:hypothetical protein